MFWTGRFTKRQVDGWTRDRAAVWAWVAPPAAIAQRQSPGPLAIVAEETSPAWHGTLGVYADRA